MGAELFDLLTPLHKLDTKEDKHEDGKEEKNYHKKLLTTALKLNDVGVAINFYNSKEMTFKVILNGLVYTMTHEQRLIIAYITKSTNKVFIDDKYFNEHKTILPDLAKLKWLCLINNIANTLSLDCSMQKYKFEFDSSNKQGVLKIKSEYDSFMLNSALSALKLPKSLKLEF
jgi:exopolyphosphatase/guanosine-5'-triphosphate,3'-diphosphate pyrophosphatase